MKAKVTISRDSKDMVNIRFRDSASGIEFAEVALTLEVFGSAITGLSEQEGNLEVRGLQFVGKKKITERRSIECPLNTYDKKVLEKWLSDNAQEDGWMLSVYLGSQGSVNRVGDKTMLNYSVMKYVSVPEL